jgi:TRAP-type C4-dicarboxylate transport system permease small subunit
MEYWNTAVIVFEIFFAWVCWQWSQDSFEEEKDALGYLWIFVSAMNFASAMSAIF